MAEDRMLNDEILLGLIKANGGGGGTTNYNSLENKPQIAGIELQGDKSLADLGIASAQSVSNITNGESINNFSGVETALANKVDKVNGKGLSTNDFTDTYKTAIGDNTTAIGANTTAISGIKDGTNIDSFADVETALADKADKSAVKTEFIGTTAEWNALTAEQKKAYDTYQLTDDYTEASGGLLDYSTTEQLTGQKWIDGKDIYFKTLSTPISITANDQLIDSGLSGIDTLIDHTIRLTRENEDVGNGFNGGTIDVLVRDNALRIKSHDLVTADNYVVKTITIYYTKTTV